MTDDAEEAIKSSAVNKVTTSAFPETHLPPWMSSYNFKIMVALSKMATIARISEKADRNVWRDRWVQEHDGKEPTEKDLPIEMRSAEKKDEKMAEDFDIDVHARGAAAAYAYGVNALVQEIHDRAVSVNQLGRKQAIAVAIGASAKSGPSGVAEFERPEKKHFWSRTPKQETAGLR
jgi:hypothetical protein